MELELRAESVRSWMLEGKGTAAWGLADELRDNVTVVHLHGQQSQPLGSAVLGRGS